MTTPSGHVPPGHGDQPGYGEQPGYHGPPGYLGPPGHGGPPGYDFPPGYGGPPAYGYDAPPPAPGTQYGPGGQQPYPGQGPDGAWAAWGGPATPPGMVLIPGHPPMTAATPGQRALGRLIDSVGYLVLLGAAIAGIIAIISNASGDSYTYRYDYGYPATSSGDLTVLWIYPILGAVWVIIVGYEWLTIGLTGATVGDRLMGVRFVNTRDGGRPGAGRALGRAALLGGSVIVCYGVVFLLLLFSMFFDSSNGRYQSWLDKLCGMQAVSTRG